jgi:hypothetical protein
MKVSFIMDSMTAKENIHIMNSLMMENGRMDVKMDMELKLKRTNMSTKADSKIMKEMEKEFYI